MVNGEEKKKSRSKKQRVIKLLFIVCLLFFAINLKAFAKKSKVYTPEEKYKYEQKVLRKKEKENYERSLLPVSGYMTREEYDKLSKDIPNADRVIPEYKLPKDIQMEYVPQPIYKVVHYNDPPGSPELHIYKNLQYDRTYICPGITSPNKDILVYPVVYYYVNNQCTSGDLFVIPLDKTLPIVQRIMRANIIKQIPKPILSTGKGIEERFIFRTMTPIDFSKDGSKLLAKEKIGNVNDGIWETNIWVYDFNTQTARKISEVKEAIAFYWKNVEGLNLDERRWDIYPLGFDAQDPNRVAVSAYGYTGKIPKFLGVWSVDCNSEQSRLVSLFKASTKITVSGFKLEQDGVVDPIIVKEEEKKQKKSVKKKRKAEKKAQKAEKKKKKQELNKKLKEMKAEERAVLKEYGKMKRSHGSTEVPK